MKKTLLVLPLAILLANCSSSRNANTSANANMNTPGSTTTAAINGSTSTSGSMSSTGAEGAGSGSMATSASGSATSGDWNNKTSTARSFSTSTNWDVYDPNNYMQNPDKYLRPHDLGKTGGWTYNKDWRRNTNFTQEAVGQWQLVMTPEVAANWMPDTRRPETYASFWTPEAIMSRYQASMAAAARTRDSIAALNATASVNTTAPGRKGRKQSSMSGNGSSATASWSANAGMSGSGTTGSMATGGSSSMNADMNANSDNAAGMTNSSVTIPFMLRAVNGNNFMLPTLNLHIDNGSFTAYTGCNNAVGTIVVNGSSLRFEEPATTANVECIGGFDQAAFIDRLRRADSYDVVDNQFRLKQGDQVLMVFAKNAQ